MDVNGFVREVYLRSVPSIDLSNVEKGVKINPSDHKLKMSEYGKIREEWGIEAGTDEFAWCVFFMMNQGPKLVD